jgi:hypothetical protein
MRSDLCGDPVTHCEGGGWDDHDRDRASPVWSGTRDFLFASTTNALTCYD